MPTRQRLGRVRVCPLARTELLKAFEAHNISRFQRNDYADLVVRTGMRRIRASRKIMRTVEQPGTQIESEVTDVNLTPRTKTQVANLAKYLGCTQYHLISIALRIGLMPETVAAGVAS